MHGCSPTITKATCNIWRSGDLDGSTSICFVHDLPSSIASYSASSRMIFLKRALTTRGVGKFHRSIKGGQESVNLCAKRIAAPPAGPQRGWHDVELKIACLTSFAGAGHSARLIAIEARGVVLNWSWAQLRPQLALVTPLRSL